MDEHGASTRPRGDRPAVAGHAAERGSHSVLALTLLSAAVAVTAATGLALRLAPTPAQVPERVSASADTPSLIQAAEEWLSTNLPYSGKVIADDTVRAALIRAGFPPAEVLPPGNVASCAAASFVVVTTALHMAATAQVALGRCLRSTLPVAVFGVGSMTVRIEQIDPGRFADAGVQRRIDEQHRRLAGVVLARNPSVRGSAAVLTRLEAGDLDLRAAAVIAALARHTLVHVTNITGDPAERTAGLAARTVDLVLTNPAALTNRAGWRVRIASAQRGGTHRSVRLVWSFTSTAIHP
ncbi:MAG: hypothetical protein ABR604_03440 [Jatrophihabitantaceae bacterium]